MTSQDRTTKCATFQLLGTSVLFAALLLIPRMLGAQSKLADKVALPSFAADQIRTQRGRTTNGKIYAEGSAMRMDVNEGGKKSIVIMRFDRQILWTLMPEQQMYVEMPLSNTGEWAAAIAGTQIKRESLGTERVGAYTCEKSRVQASVGGQSSAYLEWAAKELNGFVVKRQDEKGSWSTEYQNVRLGHQDPSLFELPAGYKKFNMSGMLPKRQ
jgi:hypothetical protein